jgi:hypothetical protein
MEINFWDIHGIGFIFCMFIFPRLTMLFATVMGGFWWWIGLIFAPRLTVAILATMYFGSSNTVLVVFTWIWALCGEGTEKSAVSKRS